MDKNLRLQVILGLTDKMLKPMQGNQKAARALNEQLRAQQAQLKALKGAQADVANYRGLKTAMAADKRALAAAQEKAQALGRAYAATEAPTRKMTTALTRARAEVTQLKNAQGEHVRRLNEVRTRLDAAGVSTRTLGRDEKTLRDNIARTNTQLDAQKAKLKQLGDQQRQVTDIRDRAARTQAMAGTAAGAGAGAIGAGLAIAAPLNASAEAARGLQSDMTTIAQRSDMSAAATLAMERSIRASAIASNQYRTDVVASMDVLTAAGQTEAQALAALPSIGRAATAYREDPRDLSRASAAAQQNLRIDPSQNARVLDIMAATGKRGSFEIGNMARELPSLTAGYAMLGQEGVGALADIAAAAQIAMRGAGSPEEAATNLGNLIQKISSPETERRFAKLGINLRQQMEAAAKAGQTPLEAITEISRRALAGGATMGQLFEDAQVQKALGPLLEATDLYRSIRTEAMAANGVVDRDFARRMLDDAEGIKAARIAAGDLAVTAGQHLAPAVRFVARAGAGMMAFMNGWAQRNPGMAKGAVIVLAAVAGLILIFGGLAMAAAAILAPFAVLQFAWAAALPLLAPIATGIASMAVAAWSAAGAFIAATWPILLIIAAVAALAYAAFLIYRNWGPISAWFGGVWTKVKEMATAAFSFLTTAIMNFTPVGLFVRAFMAVWPFLSSIGERFRTFGGQLIMGIINGVLGGIPRLLATIMRAGGRLITAFKNQLGIHSPSRVFADFGNHTMAGLAIGIERARNQPLDALGGVGAAMAGAMVLGSSGSALAAPSAPSTAANAPIAGDTIINVYPLPGQDARQIADEVKRLIDDDAASRRRRSFEDDPE